MNPLETYEGWCKAALMLLRHKPNWTAIGDSTGLFVKLDGTLYATECKPAGSRYRVDDLVPLNPIAWGNGAWLGTSVTYCKALITAASVVQLRSC